MEKNNRKHITSVTVTINVDDIKLCALVISYYTIKE
jgi:hypothetical protein